MSELEVDPALEDAYDCPACEGYGTTVGPNGITLEDCALCNGTGIVTKLEGERWRNEYYPKETE